MQYRTLFLFLFLNSFTGWFTCWGMGSSFDFTGSTPVFEMTPTGLLRPVAINNSRGTKRTRSEAGLARESRSRVSAVPVLTTVTTAVRAEPENQEVIANQPAQSAAGLTYQALPAETQAHILSFLPQESLDIVRQVSHDQRAVANSLRRTFRMSLSDITSARLRGPYIHVTHLTLTRHAVSYQSLGIRQVLLIAQNFPHLTHLSLSGLGITLDAFNLLTYHTSFNNLRQLDISSNRLTDEHFAHFRDAVFNDTLEVLTISNTRATTNSLIALSQPGVFPGLRVLNASNNSFGAAGFEALTRADFSTQLEELRVSRTALDAREEQLKQAFEQLNKNFKRLRVLDISYNTLNDALVASLGKGIFAHILEELFISSSKLTHIPFESWRDTRAFPNLRILRASGNNLGTAGIRALRGCIFVDRLESLFLGSNNLTAESIQELARGTFLHLRELVLAYNPFGDAGLQHLITSEFSARLRSLNIAYTRITQVSTHLIRNNYALRELTSLTIGGNILGSAGFIDLAHAAFAAQLELLSINAATISVDGMQTIAALRAFPRLTSLNFSANWSCSLNWLAQTAFAQHLVQLNLNYTNITLLGLESLVGQNTFINLRVLDLSDNMLIANGLNLLLQASFARNLRALNLGRTGTSAAFTTGGRNRILRISFPNLQIYGCE